MTKKICTLYFMAFSLFLHAQPDFKEVFESTKQNDRFSNMLNLRAYQQAKPDHAIVYFLLGEINDQYMRETDPTRYFEALQSNYNQLSTYYSLAKAKLDERQARQDREYFGEVEKISDRRRTGLEDVVHEVNKRIASAETYFNHAKTVNESYIRCINKYNECLFSFRQIVSGFPNYKDLYLLASADMQRRILLLSENFSESLKNFEAYRNACKELPHLLSTPQLELLPIETYRLEGLVESDFTAPVVRLWDFGQWANDFMAILNSDIKTIRDQLIANDKSLDNQINRLIKEEVYSDELTIEKPEERFQFLIAKYDPQSMCNKLIDYKTAKIDFLKQTRMGINDPAKPEENFTINRLRFYRDLAFQLEDLNKRSENLKQSVSIDHIGKYFDFYETRYRGLDGLNRWCDVEKYNNTLYFNNNLRNLHHFLSYERKKGRFKGETITYQKKQIAIGDQAVSSTQDLADTLVTQITMHVGKTNILLAGIEIGADSIVSPFVAMADTARQVKWFLKPFPNNKRKKCCRVTHMHFASDSSIYAVINERNVLEDKSENINHLLRCSWQGKILSFQPIDTSGVPRFFHFDEIADEFLLITKGTLYEEVTDSDEQLTVSLFNNKLPCMEKQINNKGKPRRPIVYQCQFHAGGNSTSTSLMRAMISNSIMAIKAVVLPSTLAAKDKLRMYINTCTPMG